MIETFTLDGGEEIPLIFTVRRGARNIVLRPRTTPTREISVSVPALVSRARAMAFIEEKRKWLNRIFANAPQKITLRPGDTIMLFGEEVKLGSKSQPIISNDYDAAHTIVVSGAPEFFERRVHDEIKKMFLARVKLEMQSVPPALRPARIAIHDTTSRWGSCSSTGTISFSWRLAFAPLSVMRYVILHEVSHRKYMDHSPQFWALVSKLYGPGVERAKRWLSIHGAELHRYL